MSFISGICFTSIFTITISLLIYETTSAQADLSLTGVVISEEDGKPVSYVTVNIKSTNRHTLTNDSGRFLIPVKDKALFINPGVSISNQG